jgi:anti-anti-sigma regulatory factor
VTLPMLCLVVAPAPSAVVVWPHGVLDHDASASLANILGDLFAGPSALAVAVDLTQVDRFDLAVVEMFAAAAVVAEKHGRTLSVRCACDEAVAVLTTCGLARLLTGSTEAPKSVRSARQQDSSRRSHPAGSALPGPGPELVVGSTRIPKRRRTQ